MAPESVQEREARSRTRLANERTYLAWWRTGLTCFAVAIGVGRLIPAVSDEGQEWEYALVGGLFAALGVGLIGLGLLRFRAVARAIDEGEPAVDDVRAVLLTAAAGVLLGLSVIAVVVVAS